MLGLSLLEIVARNWAFTAILLTFALAVLVLALVTLRYARIALNIMRTTKPPLARNPLDFERLSGEAVSFLAYDGLRLNGMLIRAPRRAASRGLVLFAHEYCSDMHSCARYCRPLHEAGYDVLTFDFRGHGQSACGEDYHPRQWVTNRELDDMRGAVAFAQGWLAEQQRDERIAIVGVSRGACAGILIAAEQPAVAAIVADGAFSTDMMIEYFLQRWAAIFTPARVMHEHHPPVFWRFMRWILLCMARREFGCSFPSIRKTLMRMGPRSIFFIHGERDSYLPVEQSRRLYALAPQPKFLWIAPGARHNQAAVMHPETYARLSLQFLDAYLTPAAGTARGGAAEAAVRPAVTLTPV